MACTRSTKPQYIEFNLGLVFIRSRLCCIGKFYLVHWPEEDSVSVVAGEDVAEGQRELGQTCSIRIGRKRFPGKIAAIGRKL